MSSLSWTYSQTPSPFPSSRRNPPARRIARPQFAPSPRFLLSQTGSPGPSGDLEIVDDDGPLSTMPAGRTPALSHSAKAPRRQRDTIEDPEGDEFPRNINLGEIEANESIDDPIDSTPPIEPDTPGPLDADYEALFGPARDSSKRRRLSGAGQSSSNRHANVQRDRIQSFSPEVPRVISGRFESPASHRPILQPRETGLQETPRMSVRPTGSATIIPANSSTRTPLGSKPRFLLSTMKLSSSQPVFKHDMSSASQPTSLPTERKKPAFILPRSPSPSLITEDIPAPFSPSSRALHRRGRRRSGGPGYAPGGMAAEVRSWILEIGSKRDQTLPKKPPINADVLSRDHLNHYLIVGRVVRARQELHSSSGLLNFVEAETVTDAAEDREKCKINIMAIGPSRSRPLPMRTSTNQETLLHPGDQVGVHRGLAWDVEIPCLRSPSAASAQHSDTSENDDKSCPTCRWLVAMEWDLIQEDTG